MTVAQSDSDPGNENVSFWAKQIYLNGCWFLGSRSIRISLSPRIRPCITKWRVTVFTNFDSACIIDAGGIVIDESEYSRSHALSLENDELPGGIGELVGQKVDAGSTLGVEELTHELGINRAPFPVHERFLCPTEAVPDFAVSHHER